MELTELIQNNPMTTMLLLFAFIFAVLIGACVYVTRD